MIGHALAAIIATGSIGSMTSTHDVLPDGWRADGGIPVELDNGTLYMYGDTFNDYGPSAHNSAVLVSYGVTIDMLNILPTTSSGSYYWPMDAVQLADGSLFVLASEVITTGEGLFGFQGIDTDAFVVTDPTSLASWHLARKIDDGPWSDGSAVFLDQVPDHVVTRDAGSTETHLQSFNPNDPSTGWVDHGVTYDGSDGVFIPVHDDDGIWWGITWDMAAQTATVQHSESAMGPWAPGETFSYSERVTYGHALAIIDDQMVYRFSNGDGTQRPEYHEWNV